MMKVVPIATLLAIVLGFALPVASASASTSPVHLKITTYSDPGLTHPTSRVATGGSLYVVVSLVDKSGNPVAWTGPVALRLVLSARAGYFTATNVFIDPGSSNTATSFGLIVFSAPSTPGVRCIVASGVLSGAMQHATERIHVVPSAAVH